MKDKSFGKNTFWIYSTNKFVWVGVVICSIFSAFMIYLLCVANLSENKVLFIFLLPISLSILLIYWALPSKILLCEDRIEERSLFGKEASGWMRLIRGELCKCISPTVVKRVFILTYLPSHSSLPAK